MRGILATLVHRRIFGIRLMELIAGGMFAVTASGVYTIKAAASREAAAIAEKNREIAGEIRRQTMLRANLAELERPARLAEELSVANLHLAPISAKQEAAPTDLTELARRAGVSR